MRPSREGAGPSQEGGREDRVRAAPAVSRAKVSNKNAHEHTGSAEAVRPSPRNGFTAYSALSLVTGFVVTIAGVMRSIITNLTPASGRQDHTTSPSTSGAVRQKRIGVHRIPPHVRDDRETPLVWDGMATNKPVIWVGRKQEYFSRDDWTGQITLKLRKKLVCARNQQTRHIAHTRAAS